MRTVEEILGPINEVYFTVKLDEGMKPESFQADAPFYISPDKLLPMQRFLPPPPGAPKRTFEPVLLVCALIQGDAMRAAFSCDFVVG